MKVSLLMPVHATDLLPFAGRILRMFPAVRAGVPILTYHRIAERAFSHVTRENFAAQMQFVRGLYEPVPLGEIVDCLEAGRPFPPRAIVVTFDDGYRDNYQHAFPVLKALGIPATFFVSTGMVGGTAPFWWDRISEGLKDVDAVIGAWPALSRRLLGASRDEAVRIVTQYAKELDSSEARAMIDAICEPPGQFARKTMNWSELREMADAGMEIGSHTVTHPILARQSSDEAVWEIVESKATIEANLGRPVDHLSYPNGRPCDVSEEVLRSVKEAGYKSACSTVPGTVKRGSSRFMLERISAWNRPVRFLCRALGLTRR